MQAIYQLDVQGPQFLGSVKQFFTENETDNFVLDLANQWTVGTWQNLSECDRLIEACTIKWQLSRLAPVDRSILRLAVYQLKFCPDIPPRVVINEAIELAKKFGSEKSGSFVNGVLDAVLRRIGQRT